MKTRLSESDVREAISEAKEPGRLSFSNTDISKLDLSYLDLKETNLSGCDIRETNLDFSRLSNANLSGANLSRASLYSANLEKANLSGSILVKTILDKANLIEADFSWANLRSARLVESILLNTNFSDAILDKADLSGTNLSSAILDRASLRNLQGQEEYTELSSNLIYAIRPDITKFNLRVMVGSGQLEIIRALTPSFLETNIVPYLKAITSIESIIAEAGGKGKVEVRVKFIRQNSPVSVSLEGASTAINAISEAVIPWRKEHARRIAKLLEQQKEVEIERQKAEVLEIRAVAARERAEAEKLQTESNKLKVETEKLILENEKLRLELEDEKIKMVHNIIASTITNLPEGERSALVDRLLPPVDVIANSRLEIGNIK